MNYYIDTEFLEGTQKEIFPIILFRKNTPPKIDLISIGIVAEDGREYYAISKDFNLKEAWNRFDLKQHSGDRRNQGDGTYKEYWIRENVLKPIWRELFFKLNFELGLSNKQIENFHKEVINGKYDKHFSYSSLKAKINKYGKTNKQIAKEIISFTDIYVAEISSNATLIVGATENMEAIKANLVYDKPTFYAYYADYDWVAFCWLFGKMMDLPNGFPMYCNDLKQMIDNNCVFWKGQGELGMGPKDMTHEILKQHIHYPKQENEHSAIHDARWNKKLHEFLNNL
jgi:hypothetical protein